jgi:hypothetical protein
LALWIPVSKAAMSMASVPEASNQNPGQKQQANAAPEGDVAHCKQGRHNGIP